ncbi:MAG: c-type cytochrome [Deltaproteobacteria bacterium]|nr:c-type cytochrome [Deltaproteobacteria bacterium]
MLIVAALSLAMAAPAPFTLPPAFSKSLGSKPASFGPTVTVVVTKVPVPAAQKAPNAKELAQGLKLYQQRCVLCHGDAGRGDGVGARRIEPEPQHLNDVIWQANVTDDEIKKAILDGGAAVSRSPMMPANPDLKTKPDVVKALIGYVRTLRAKYGSALGSMVLADKSSVAVHADADAKGNATLVFSNVAKGPAVITVMVDGEGKVGCTLNVVVDKDVTIDCK